MNTASTSSRCGDHARQFPGCSAGLLGPSTHFSLDLRTAAAPTPIVIVIDADFSFEAALARGPCGDSVLEACATPLQVDGRSRALSVTLSPAYYELVVTGRAENDQGSVHVAASVEPPSCSAPPSNDECEAGLAFDASLPTQTLIGTAACGSVTIPIRCALDAVGDVFYDLDLSSRAAPALLEVAISEVGASSFRRPAAALFTAGESGCGEFAMCGTNFTSRLLPGRYRIGVTQSSKQAFALRVRLRDSDCAATTNDTWQTAIELDPGAERQQIGGNTACGNNDFAGACNGDRGAPELFYRLDLRSQTAPRFFRFAGTSDSELMVYVLLPDDTGVPSRVAGCEALSPETAIRNSALFTLAPRLYYFAIDGRGANAGRFELEVTQEEVFYPVPTNCFSQFSTRCLDDSEPACADSRANPECLSTGPECGLEPAVYAGFCARFTGCCEGSTNPDECRAAWSSNLECK